MEDTRITIDPVFMEPPKRSRRVSVWLCLLCAVLAAAFAVLLTSLYYVKRMAGLETVSEAMELVKKIAIMGTPLLLNEVMWSMGTTFLNQCYSVRGLEVISALNISSTVSNLFFCAFFAMGTTVSVVVGQLLGAGELERAVDEAKKLIAFAVALCAVVGTVLVLVSPVIPEIYNTTETVKALAAQLLMVSGCLTPFHAFCNTCYFTLRSGGKTVITFIFDSGYIWCICVPLAFVLSRFTSLPILPLYIIVQSLELIKCVLGAEMIRRRKWVNNLVSK